MAALRSHKDVEFAGVGGVEMVRHGLESLFPMSELSHMGLLEIIPHLPNLWSRLQQVVEDIKQRRPQVVVTIDCQDFSYQIAKRVKKLGIPVIHYVAPTVWAWRPGRARKIAQVYSHLLTLFDFEPDYFLPHGLEATWVGHPLGFQQPPRENINEFYQKYDLHADRPILCLLPGSRIKEVTRLGEMLYSLKQWLQQHYPEVQVIIPLAPAVCDVAAAYFPNCTLIAPEDKATAFRVSALAVAASGTVTLELALAQVPTLVVYRVNAVTAWLGRWLMKIPYVSLPNIILKAEVMPELLQEKCTVKHLVSALETWLKNPAHLEKSRQQLAQVRKHLCPAEGKQPSEIAAEIILKKFVASVCGGS